VIGSPFRFVPPSGAPLSTSDLLRWWVAAFSPDAAEEALQSTIRRRFDARHVELVSTGRAGMTLLLRAMRTLAPERNEVIVPSYTCYSVAASAVKAGLRPRIVDIDPDTLDYDPVALDRQTSSKVLAITATNLYGFPSDLPTVMAVARRHGALVIDDAAQAMGARCEGRWAGTAGDAGLFSFDKGKNVSAIDGGAILTDRDDLAAAILQEVAGLRRPSAGQSAIHVAKALAYYVMLRPWLYSIPARIPQLGLGRTIYTTEYPLAKADAMLAALAATMMRRLDEFTEIRRSNARELIAALDGISVKPIAARHATEPVYLRLPVLVLGKRQQRATIEALTRGGIGATGSYPRSLADVPELQSSLAAAPFAAGGRDVARRIVTLPTHSYVTSADVRHIRAILMAEKAEPAVAAAAAS
jgi:perosamine synthetase